ncbi:hypothetical protein Emed_003513 [Eimeria media]
MLLRCCQQRRPLQQQQQKLLQQPLLHLRRGRKTSPAAAAAAAATADESRSAASPSYWDRAWGRLQQQQRGLLLAQQQKQQHQQQPMSSSSRMSKRGFVLQRAQLLLDLPRLEGDKFIERCTQAAAAPACPPGMWGIISSQVHAKGGQLYPLQLLQLLRLFADAGYADEALLATVAARAGDFIGEASPPRAVELLRLTRRLGLSHPLVQQPLQQRLLELLHLLQPHELPSVICNLASLHAHAKEAPADSPNRSSSSSSSRRRGVLLLDGLATQAELFSSSAKSPTTLLSCVEALSRLGFEHEPLISLFTNRLDAGLQELTLKDLVVAATAAARLQLPQTLLICRAAAVAAAAAAAGTSCYSGCQTHAAAASRLDGYCISTAAAAATPFSASVCCCSSSSSSSSKSPLRQQQQQELRSPPILKECVSAVDKLVGCTYTVNQLPRLLLLLTLLAADDLTHVQQQQLLQQLQQQLGAAVGLLSAQQLRLCLQQREILKEVCFLLTRLPNAAAAAAAAAGSVETQESAAAAALRSPPEGPLPIGTPDLDYSKVDLKPVLSRMLLVSPGDTPKALHYVGPREVYVHLGQQQQQQQWGALQEMLPGVTLLQQVPELTTAEAFSLACVTSACSPKELLHEGPNLWQG